MNYVLYINHVNEKARWHEDDSNSYNNMEKEVTEVNIDTLMIMMMYRNT